MQVSNPSIIFMDEPTSGAEAYPQLPLQFLLLCSAWNYGTSAGQHFQSHCLRGRKGLNLQQ